MAQDDVEIKVVDRQTPTGADSVDYQPFGVKVLKLRIRRNSVTRPKLGPIWVRPKGYVRPDAGSDDPNRWRVYGTAQDDPDLWVAWGAGDERGFCAKTKDRFKIDKVPLPIEDDAFYYVYLHLIHRPPDPLQHTPTDKTLVVQASGQEGQVYGEKTVRLTVPQAASNPLRAVWKWDLDAGVSAITLQGAGNDPPQIPTYVSRWWPTHEVAYIPVEGATMQFLQDLQIAYHRQDGSADRGRINVTLGGEPVAHLSGALALPLHDYRLCSAEVLRFPDDYHLVLRLWFFWVHLGFSADQLMTYVPPERRADWRAEAERVSKGLRKGLFSWHRVEEVADVERFDLVLDPGTLRFKYVGADTHWQEFWGQVKRDQPLDARIATLLDTKKVLEQARDVPSVGGPPVFNPLANGLCDIVNRYIPHKCPHRPKGRSIPVDKLAPGEAYEVCPRCGSHFKGQGVRALGLAKHAPWVGENVHIYAEAAVSSSVLDG
jgi:hypothetical protein